MKKNILISLAVVLASGIVSFTLLIDKQSISTNGDYASEHYGDQEVMTTNLKITTFRNGDEIPHAADNAAWERAGENKKPAWAWYNNDEATAGECGILYNWYAVNDPRDLAPEGWHIPTKEEWKQLGEYFAEKHPRELSPVKSETGWVEYGNGDNTTGFNAFACGTRTDTGEFNQFGSATAWWSASTDGGGKNSLNSIYFSFSSRFKEFVTGQNIRGGGLSVRCMRD